MGHRGSRGVGAVMTFSAADPAAIDLLNAKIEELQEHVISLEGTSKYWMDQTFKSRTEARACVDLEARAEAAEARVEILEAEIRAMHKLPAALDAAFDKDGP